MEPQNSSKWAIPGLLKDSYPLEVSIILIVATLYMGIFTTLNNYYVFRPKIIAMAHKHIPNPSHKFLHILFETGLCLTQNLSFIGFSFSSSFLSSSGTSLQVFAISDGIWIGVVGSIIAYRNGQAKQPIDKRLALKNSAMLVVMYAWVVVHCYLDMYLFYFPLAMLVFFLLNQMMTEYFGKVEEVVLFLLSETAEEDHVAQIGKRKPKSQFLDVGTLAAQYGGSEDSISGLSEQFSKRRSQIKLKSKAKVYQKLHDIYIRVHLAQQKHVEAEMKRVVLYFGRLNGTIPLEKNTGNNHTNEQDNKSDRNLDTYNKFSTTAEEELQEKENAIFEEPPDFLLYIFPIRLLEYSRTISIVSSILLNLGFGFLLDYTLQILIKLRFGTLFTMMMSFLMVPLVSSSIKLLGFFNEVGTLSMARYGIVGLFLFISCFSSLVEGQLFYVTWLVTPNLQWIFIAQAVFLIYAVLVCLVLRWQEYRLLTLAFLVFLGVVGYLSFQDFNYIY